MAVAAYLYPWDVDGDPAAADRIAALGVTEVSLAAAYHAVRAVTPFHPRHRIVTRDAAVYHRRDPARWSAGHLVPADPDPAEAKEGAGAVGSFERAADALRAAGLRVNAWIVLAHNGRLAATHPECAVRNAWGDSYPWALCAGSPAVAEYAAALAAEIAALDAVADVELEACGWYGYDHGSAHDKTGGTPAGPAGRLLDACFCADCAATLRVAGADPDAIAAAVRSAFDGGPDVPGELATTLATVRAATAAGFLEHVVGAVRAAAPGKDVLVHAHPDPAEAGSNPGFELPVLLGPAGADGIILACPGPAAPAASFVAATARAVQSATAAAAIPAGRRIVATLPAVAALGADTGELPAKAKAVLAAGATDLRLYHAGLASAADHAAQREVAEL
ncbi:MAG TPA: hypothetical protein VIZ20_11020 [Streptosporangiaceae bacterium]